MPYVAALSDVRCEPQRKRFSVQCDCFLVFVSAKLPPGQLKKLSHMYLAQKLNVTVACIHADLQAEAARDAWQRNAVRPAKDLELPIQ